MVTYPIPGSIYDGGYIGVGLEMEKIIFIIRKAVTLQIRGTGIPQIKTRFIRVAIYFCCGKRILTGAD